VKQTTFAAPDIIRPMKIIKNALILVFLAVVTVGAHGETNTVSVKHYAYWLQGLCQAKKGDDAYAVKMSLCRGFILGVASGVDGMSTPDGTLTVSVDPIDLDAFVADYLLWLDTHEKDKNEEASAIVFRVLLQTGHARLTKISSESSK
jgi:hypothetical protein